MSHCMLPRRGSPAAALATDPETYKYVDTCIATMLELMLPHGGLASLEVKVFGGADMFPTSLAGRTGAVGAQNASVAMELLQAPKLRVLRTDLGGTRGRQIRFDAETGEVFVRYLKAAIPVMA